MTAAVQVEEKVRDVPVLVEAADVLIQVEEATEDRQAAHVTAGVPAKEEVITEEDQKDRVHHPAPEDSTSVMTVRSATGNNLAYIALSLA